MAGLLKHLLAISLYFLIFQENRNTKFTVDAKESEGAELHGTAAAICGKTELEKLEKLEVSNAELRRSLANEQMLVLELRRGYVKQLQANLELRQTNLELRHSNLLKTRPSVLEERFERVEEQVKALMEQWENKKNSDVNGGSVASSVSDDHIPDAFTPISASALSPTTAPASPPGPCTPIPAPSDSSLSEVKEELGRSLIQATKEGETNDVRRILERGADAHYVDGAGNTALHYASWSGRLQIVDLLLKAGAPVNASNEGWTPLHSASHEGQKAVVQELIKAGADIHARDGEGSTPLHVAAYSDHIPVIRILLRAGADRKLKNNLGKTPYDSAWNGQAKALLSLD